MNQYIIFTAAFFSSLSQLGCSVTVKRQDSANMELQNGTDQCQGLVKFQDPSTNTWWQACSSTAGESEAIVICRQLGCNISHAEVVESTQFGFSSVDFYAYFPYSCDGNEEALSSCHSSGQLICSSGDPLSAVAVDCHSKPRIIEEHKLSDLNSNLMIIIMCNIVVGLLIVVIPTDIAIIIYFIRKRNQKSRLEFKF